MIAARLRATAAALPLVLALGACTAAGGVNPVASADNPAAAASAGLLAPVQTAQGLVLTSAFYWDLNDQTREWSKRFSEKNGGKQATMVQAGVYASVLHYLKAVDALDDKDSAKVMEWMKANPSEDPLFGKGEIRADGRHVHDMYLFRVKKPEESKGDYDYFETLATIPAAEAFRPLNEGDCPLVK